MYFDDNTLDKSSQPLSELHVVSKQNPANIAVDSEVMSSDADAAPKPNQREANQLQAEGEAVNNDRNHFAGALVPGDLKSDFTASQSVGVFLEPGGVGSFGFDEEFESEPLAIGDALSPGDLF